MILGMDIDEPLFPWHAHAHEACQRAGITAGVTPTSWNPANEYGCTQQEWLDVLADAALEGFYRRAPIPGSVEACQRITDAGHEIHLVTTRGAFRHGQKIRAATAEWAHDFHIPHAGLHFVTDKTRVRTNWSVDDLVENTTALDNVGTTTFLQDTQYNRHHQHPRRITHVSQVADLLERQPALV